MENFIITCPICKKKYKLTQKDSSSLAHKIFSCPNCSYSAPFSTLISGLPISQPTTQLGNRIPSEAQASHSATKVSNNIGMQSNAYLTVMDSNAKFLLNPGVYILGRKSSDSSATLQLTPDISMSRQHARLAVQFVGGKLMAQIVGLKASNPIIVNGRVYAAGQPCTLKSGDNLQFGMTKIVISI